MTGKSHGKGWQPTVKEHAVYDRYLGGSTRGDLTVHVKRGRLGIMKPERAMGNAFAAWKAGEALAARETATMDSNTAPGDSPCTGS